MAEIKRFPKSYYLFSINVGNQLWTRAALHMKPAKSIHILISWFYNCMILWFYDMIYDSIETLITARLNLSPDVHIVDTVPSSQLSHLF